jgi:adenylate kinase
MLSDFNTDISIVLGLEVNEDELVTRLLLRGQTSGRADDQSEDTIRNRFQEYLNKTLPIQNYYSAKNKYFGVEGIGEIDQIFVSLCDHLDKIS